MPSGAKRSDRINSSNGGLTTSGTLNLEIGGTVLGTGYSQISVSASATLGGTLNVSLINSFAPASGNTFTAISAPRTGTFAPANLPGGFAPPTYNPGSVVLTVP